MKVSVVVPCFNQAKYLPECLNNLLEQTYDNWECIIVDDGSTDNTEDVAQQYCKQDKRFKYHYQANKGLSGARNAGIRQANGELLYFLDSDDGISPDTFSEFVAAFSCHPQLTLAFCGYALTRESLTLTIKTVVPKVDLTSSDLYRLLCKGNIAPVHAAMVRREVVDRVGLFDETLKSCEDWDFWLRVARVTNQAIVIKKILVQYRLTLQSMTRNVKTFFEASLHVLERTRLYDSRVIDPIKEYENGYAGYYQKARVSLHMKCAGLYLSQHKVKEAKELIFSAGIDGAITTDHVLEIWTHVLFGSLQIADRNGAWKKFGADMKLFTAAVENEYHLARLGAMSIKKIKRYNAGFFMRIVYRLIPA